MSVPVISFRASPPKGVFHAPIHGSVVDFDVVNSRPPPPPPPSSASSPSPFIQKPAIGGLSSMFSEPMRHSDRSLPQDDLSCSYSSMDHSPISRLRRPPVACSPRDPSPVSVLHRSPVYSFGPFRALGRDRLLRRFVTAALGSCLDYDPPSFPASGIGRFPFEMEDCFSTEINGISEQPYAREMLSDAQSRHDIFKEEYVVRAFYEAEKAHRGQMRASGDHYLQHCLETSLLLANIGADATVVAAGLLHDSLDDSFLDHAYIAHNFGSGVADLVVGVSKLSHLSKLARDNDAASKTAEADKLHTMFLAMADARAVLIKVADRLHNMMTLDALPINKRRRFAKETLEIFAPLANRLGVFSWKEQIENLCFKHLNPEQHKYLSSKVLKTFDEAIITSAKEELSRALDVEGLTYHAMYGRHKSLYSIHSKMLKKNLMMDEIHDIHGLRLIVENGNDFYRALDVVHGLWPNVPGRYKDYIKYPKDNGYQSLHTVVISDCGVPLEVQIRSKEMHLQAEFGIAAHWRYKEGGCMHSSFVMQMVEWARWVLTWHCEAMGKDHSFYLGDGDSIRPSCSFPSHSDTCSFSCSPWEVHDGPILVIVLENDQMSVQELSSDATLMDLYEIISWGSSRWGARSYPTKEELTRVKVNRELVADPSTKLKMGDVIELPRKSLSEYREEIQRMYDRGFALSVKK